MSSLKQIYQLNTNHQIIHLNKINDSE